MHAERPRRIRRAGDDLARFVRIAVAADDDGQSGEVGVASHLDSGLELVEVDVQDPATALAVIVPQSLRANAFPRVAEALQRLTALGELVVHVVGVQQREQRGGLRVEVAGGARVFQQHRDVAVVQRRRGVEPHLRVAVGIRQQRLMGFDELQPVAAVGEQSIQRRRARAQRRRAEEEGLLLGLLVLVEQHDHQAGAAAEPAEQRALADTRRRGDIVGGDGVGAALGDQPARSLEQ